MRKYTALLLTAVLAVGCSSRDSSSSVTLGERRTELRPNDAGVVIKIGSACKPEDGWQYQFPPGWPTGQEAADSGVPTTVPIPPDHKETHQLEPGIGYCVTNLATHPQGFFTSNCKTDGDCPREARCDGSWCNVPCNGDTDCGVGLYCPPNPGGTRFCRQGCPAAPVPATDCYFYGGPWVCPYPVAGGERTICRCVLQPLNTAVWQCTPEGQCPPSAPGETACKAPARAGLTCSYGDVTCKCEADRFRCLPGPSTVTSGTATATTDAGPTP
jgi:hypothetical protein